MLTDLPEVMGQLEKTIELNRLAWSGHGSVTSGKLTWGKDKPGNIDLSTKPDIVLLSDCVYYEEVGQQLINYLF